MKLLACKPDSRFTVTCVRCGAKKVPLANAYADLDGKPFEDYYCFACVQPPYMKKHIVEAP